jgi:tryptophan-rich sensory protein
MWSGIIGSIAIMYAVLVGVNLPAPLLGLRFESSPDGERLWFEPPGYVIPLAWFILFALLGVARHLVRPPAGADLQWYVFGLAVFCASYAYYTLGLAKLTGVSALWFGFAGNLTVIVLALVVAHKLYWYSRVAGALVLPVALWTTFATAIVLGQMRAQGLIRL